MTATKKHAPGWTVGPDGKPLTLDAMRAEKFAETKARIVRHFPGRDSWESGVIARLERSRVNAPRQSLREGDSRKANLYGADSSALRWALEQVYENDRQTNAYALAELANTNTRTLNMDHPGRTMPRPTPPLRAGLWTPPERPDGRQRWT